MTIRSERVGIGGRRRGEPKAESDSGSVPLALKRRAF